MRIYNFNKKRMHPKIEEKRSVTPGPGDYNVRKDQEIKESKTPYINFLNYFFRFGANEKKLRVFEENKKIVVPGPGKYENKEGILQQTSPKFSYIFIIIQKVSEKKQKF